MYNTRIRTFYSRRIEDIAGGAKISGKVGAYNFNVLSVRSLEIEEEDEPPAFFTAARVKRDVLKTSMVGLTYADKTWKDGYSRSVSGDYLFNLGEKWKLTGQFVTSFPGDFWSSSAFFVRFARENNIYHYHIRYSNVGDNFFLVVVFDVSVTLGLIRIYTKKAIQNLLALFEAEDGSDDGQMENLLDSDFSSLLGDALDETFK